MDLAGDLAAIFADTLGFGVAATYTPDGGSPVAVRVMRRSPDRITAFGAARMQSPTTVLLVNVDQIATPAAGDRFQIGAEVFEVQGPPQRDDDLLLWQIDTRPAA